MGLTTKAPMPSRILAAIILTAVLVLLIPTFTSQAGALTRRDFGYLNDQHLTASNGDTKVCGDHLCKPGEWDSLQQSISDAQHGRPAINSTATPRHDPQPTSSVVSEQPSSNYATPVAGPLPGIPLPPLPIPVPSPGPQSLTAANHTSGYVGSDKQIYVLGINQGTAVRIYGQIPAIQDGTVTVSVKTPFNVYTAITTHTDRTGSFFVPYVIRYDSPGGRYEITAGYHGITVSGSFFLIRSSTYGSISMAQ
ncbi:MAG: hypothetical protein KGI33_05425 [Thaumarchaeota archaeon]|nr:hypothetical protein [Nitrososphaerota archaeon]